MAIERTLLYLAITTGFFGTTLGSVPIGDFHLFAARIFTGMLTFFFIIRSFSVPIKILKKFEFEIFFLLFWLIFAALSFFWAPDMSSALRNYFLLLFGIAILFFIFFYLNNTRELRTFCFIWLFILFIILGIGIWEIHTGNHLSVSGLANWENPYPDDPNYQFLQHSPTGVFTNPNDMATYLVLSLPFLLAFLRASRPGTVYWFVGIGALVNTFYILIITRSRANYLGVLLMLSLFIYLLFKSQKYGQLIKRLSFLLGLLLFFFFMISRLFNLELIYDPILLTITDLASGDILTRSKLYEYAFIFITMTYGRGLGPGGFEPTMKNYVFYTNEISNLHNWWLEILVNYGLLIFLGYLIFYYRLFSRLFSLYKGKQRAEHIVLLDICLLGLVAFPVGCISSSSILGFFPQWAFLGFSLSVLKIIGSDHTVLKVIQFRNQGMQFFRTKTSSWSEGNPS